VLQHPRKDGAFVAFATPGADTKQIGFVSNVSLDGDKLRAEYWFDTEQIANIEEATGLIESVEAGQMIEQSTGYMFDFVANAGGGTWKGRPYTVTQRNIKPDHVAILPKGIGACSIADGCGVLQVNEAIVKAPPTDSVMVAFFLEGADAVKYALSPADLPDGSEVVTPEELHVTLAYLGKVDEQKINEHDLMSRMADIARHEVFMPADVQGLGRFAAKEGKSLEPVYLSIGSAALHDFRERITSYLGDAMPAQTNGFLPHVTLAYVPQGIDAGIPMPTRETIFFHSIAVAWGGRVSVFKLQGEQRESIALSTNEKEILMDTEVTTPVTPAASKAMLRISICSVLNSPSWGRVSPDCSTKKSRASTVRRLYFALIRPLHCATVMRTCVTSGMKLSRSATAFSSPSVLFSFFANSISWLIARSST